MKKKVYIFMAAGFETIEALTPVDVLRRCGVEIITTSITESRQVCSSHGIEITTDTTIFENDCLDGDMIILPGGYPGYVNLCNSTQIGNIVKHYAANNKYIAAICGAPTVLNTYEIARGCHIVCHSSVRDTMQQTYIVTDNNVERDGKIITANGAGNSLPFSLALAEAICDQATVEDTKKKMEL